MNYQRRRKKETKSQVCMVPAGEPLTCGYLKEDGRGGGRQTLLYIPVWWQVAVIQLREVGEDGRKWREAICIIITLLQKLIIYVQVLSVLSQIC